MDTSKILVSLLIFMACITQQFSVAFLGPVLYDVLAQNHVTFCESWILFLNQGLGFILGVVVGIISVYYFEQKQAVFGILYVVNGLTLFTFGLSENFVLTNVLIFLTSVSVEALEIIILPLLVDIFGDRSPCFMQLLTSGAGIGTFLCPLILTPFLTDVHISHTNESAATTGCHTENLYETTNSTAEYRDITTHYWKAFLIFSTLLLMNGIGLILYYFTFRYRSSPKKNSNIDKGELTEFVGYPDETTYLTSEGKPAASHMIVILTAIMLGLIHGTMLALGNFLTAYVVESFHAPTYVPAYMLTAQNAVFLLFKILSSISIYKWGTTITISIHLLVYNIAAAVFVILPTSISLTWVCSILFGVGISAGMASPVAWVKENYVVSNVAISFIVGAGGICPMVSGEIFSILMIKYGPALYEYLLLSMGGAFTLTFIGMTLMKLRNGKED